MKRLITLGLLTFGLLHPQDAQKSPDKALTKPENELGGEVLIGTDELTGLPIATVSESGEVKIASGHTAEEVILSLINVVKQQSDADAEQFSYCMDGWGRAAILLQQQMDKNRRHDIPSIPGFTKLISQ